MISMDAKHLGLEDCIFNETLKMTQMLRLKKSIRQLNQGFLDKI